MWPLLLLFAFIFFLWIPKESDEDLEYEEEFLDEMLLFLDEEDDDDDW